MKNIKKIFIVLLMGILSIASFNISSEAATGYQGYAIYRDGVFFNTNWHAGMMDEPYSTDVLPVVHHPGSGGTAPYVKYDSWDNFLSGKNFKGVYRPTTTPTSSDRDLFVSLGRKLTTEAIEYNLAYQVYYDSNTEISGLWVDPSDITSMRCDGVVEYIYEWYGFRVYGSDTYWDVTRVSFWGRDHHSGTAITPEKQPGYLKLVTSSVPKA